MAFTYFTQSNLNVILSWSECAELPEILEPLFVYVRNLA